MDDGAEGGAEGGAGRHRGNIEGSFREAAVQDLRLDMLRGGGGGRDLGVFTDRVRRCLAVCVAYIREFGFVALEAKGP